jgi:hypothetical protein
MGSNNDLSSLCCNQEAGNKGVSRPGGQNVGDEACGVKLLEQKDLGDWTLVTMHAVC